MIIDRIELIKEVFMAKLLTKDKQEIINKLAEGKTYRSIGKDYNVKSTKTIFDFNQKHHLEVNQTKQDIKQSVVSVLKLALARLEACLKQPNSITPQQLSQITKDMFNIKQILSNQPTAISSKQASYKAMDSKQLDTEARKLWSAIKLLNKEKQKLK